MTTRLAIAICAMLSLSGCKATGDWSLKRDGDGLVYTCKPFDGYQFCGVTFDMEALKEILRFFETLFGKTRHALEGGPPDGTSVPAVANDPAADTITPAEP